MTKILIIGASGSIATVVRPALLAQTDAQLILAGRHPRRIHVTDADRETVLKLDVTQDDQLRAALQDVDVVYANLAGALDQYAAHLVKVMDEVGVKRLFFIATMGIYQEIPTWLGESPEPYTNSILRPYRLAADIIEDSDLTYTIIRPAWLDNAGDTTYELTKKGDPFGGQTVSRRSLADLIVRLVQHPDFGQRESFGINRPQAH